MKALDGHTLYEMLYGMKPDLAELHVFSMPCAIVRLSEKLKNPKNAVHGLWIGLQASVGCVWCQCSACTWRNWFWSHCVGKSSLSIVGKVLKFSAHQLLNVTLNHIVLTLKHAG